MSKETEEKRKRFEAIKEDIEKNWSKEDKELIKELLK